MQPYLRDYFRLREQVPGGVLWMQAGDFAECYGEDACSVAEALDIYLNRRGHDDAGRPMPMCGAPLTSLEGFAAPLRRLGRPVAVAVPNGTLPPSWRIEYLIPPEGAAPAPPGNVVSFTAARAFEPVTFNMAVFQHPDVQHRVFTALRSVAWALHHDEAGLRRLACETPEDFATIEGQMRSLRDFCTPMLELAEVLAARLDSVRDSEPPR